MYLLVVLALMLVLPVTSILVETLLRDHGVLLWPVFGKWWVFWAVGVRTGVLFYGLAGINHFTHKARNFNENIAMTSDIFTACVMLSFIIHP